jgi:hypothetical protein|tara:strand:+ start:163 stop:732 length:570 start_codon:yes stop_codon:yes gene_type:complete
MAFFIKIDENGDPVDGIITHENMEYVLETRDITDEMLAANGFAEILHANQPEPSTIGQHQEFYEGAIEKNEDGTVEQRWVITEISKAEKYRRWVDGPRQFKFLMSDWTQLADAPLTTAEIADWATYRAALRGITDTIDWPNLTGPPDITWPEAPGPLTAIEAPKWLDVPDAPDDFGDFRDEGDDYVSPE